jgi:RNase P subunit RPR2
MANQITKLPERESKHQVVTVILGSKTPNHMKDLHCVDCGRIVCNYYSETRVIISGEMREVSRPLDIMCSRCSLIYRVA